MEGKICHKGQARRRERMEKRKGGEKGGTCHNDRPGRRWGYVMVTGGMSGLEIRSRWIKQTINYNGEHKGRRRIGTEDGKGGEWLGQGGTCHNDKPGGQEEN